jgi:hypothetical protein
MSGSIRFLPLPVLPLTHLFLNIFTATLLFLWHLRRNPYYPKENKENKRMHSIGTLGLPAEPIVSRP